MLKTSRGKDNLFRIVKTYKWDATIFRIRKKAAKTLFSRPMQKLISLVRAGGWLCRKNGQKRRAAGSAG
eukprot:1209223-Amphidinium_carterae.2